MGKQKFVTDSGKVRQRGIAIQRSRPPASDKEITAIANLAEQLRNDFIKDSETHRKGLAETIESNFSKFEYLTRNIIADLQRENKEYKKSLAELVESLGHRKDISDRLAFKLFQSDMQMGQIIITLFSVLTLLVVLFK